MYVIEVRQVAESTTGLVTDKKNKVMVFENEDKARQFGIENIEKSRYIAMWQAIALTDAKTKGHKLPIKKNPL